MKNTATTSGDSLRSYPVWDRTTRWFHWINLATVIGLIAIGLVILNGKLLGISGEGKILLKTIHVLFGYVFAANLIWRFLWGFIGNRYARWGALLPLGSGYGEYLRSMRSSQPIVYAGHNPLGRLMVTALLLLLLTQAVTGLILAGTDIYYPPLGNTVKTWIVADGSTVDQVVAGAKEHIDSARYQAMRNFREPFATVHVYAFYLLLIAISIHILAVIVVELRERSGLVSAMIHGHKVFSHPPKDY